LFSEVPWFLAPPQLICYDYLFPPPPPLCKLPCCFWGVFLLIYRFFCFFVSSVDLLLIPPQYFFFPSPPTFSSTGFLYSSVPYPFEIELAIPELFFQLALLHFVCLVCVGILFSPALIPVLFDSLPPHLSTFGFPPFESFLTLFRSSEPPPARCVSLIIDSAVPPARPPPLCVCLFQTPPTPLPLPIFPPRPIYFAKSVPRNISFCSTPASFSASCWVRLFFVAVVLLLFSLFPPTDFLQFCGLT